MKRRLSECERLYWYANAQNPGNVIAVAHVRGELDLAKLQVATQQLGEMHPLLGVHVNTEKEGDFWLVTEGTSAPVVQVTDGAHDLDAIFESELNTRIAAEPHAPRSALWRCRVVRSSDSSEWVAMLTIMHMVCDASAMFIALRDWLDIYSRVLDGANAGSAVLKRWPERPAFDDMLPASFRAPGRSLWHTSRLIGRLLREQLKRPLALRAQADVPLEKRTSSVLLHTLPAHEVAALHAQCRQQGVTLHGAWMAALVLALREVVERKASQDKVAFTTPTTVRHLLDTPIDEEIGCYVSMLHAFVEAPAEKSFWELARDANRSVKASLQRQEHLAGIQLGRLISPKSKAKAERTLEGMAAQGGAGACVSNLGNYAMPSELGSLQLQQLYGFAALSFTGALLFGIVTINRRTLLCISYVPAVVKREVVDQVLSLFCAKLKEQAALPNTSVDAVLTASQSS